MCVRLSPSHPVTRIIAGLYIFLATFLIGFFVSKLGSVVYELVFSDSEATVMREQVKPPISPGPGVNKKGPLGIEYLYTGPTPDSVDILFTLTNFGSETIRFKPERNTCLFYSGSGPKTYLVGPRPCKIDIDELKPYENVTLVVPVGIDPPHYWLSIDYLVGPDGTKTHADLFVKNPHLLMPGYD